ncbi:uncharacterized protein LOC110111667 [Dendrobium catenatum]|uniref:DUF1639 domain-containing protein n=1 Tax=Dendrobium catenatum TaxID=906689 RepID=A0A2I0VEZ7_9ASPA|nr:uncharacterized protein LOC110111667 [Dendrobium catenatum]PKU61985.1 hypothetical protein MA16_Dca026875 [Dendrobium catenatum]
MAATATQRGKSQSHLHRDFPSPVLKSWGNHRLLRCDAVDGNEHIVTGKHRSILPRDDRRRLPPADAPEIAIGNEESGLEELREKLLGHLREVAGRMKVEVPRIDPSASGSPEAVRSSAAPAADAIPWNLRSKRASRNEAAQAQAPSTDRMIRLRHKDSEKEPQKFSVSLTQEEIDEDVFALTGSRPRRRPKKRARIVQRQLDAIFPGLWLSEITPELYRVPE